MLGRDVEVPVVAVSLPARVRFFFLGWLRRVRGFWYPAVTCSHPAASGRCCTHGSVGCTRVARELCRICQSDGLHRCSFCLNSTDVDLKVIPHTTLYSTRHTGSQDLVFTFNGNHKIILQAPVRGGPWKSKSLLFTVFITDKNIFAHLHVWRVSRGNYIQYI